jgi:hypothetical protein
MEFKSPVIFITPLLCARKRSRNVQKSSRGAQAARSGESRKPQHPWTYMRIFGGHLDAADWARSRFLDTSSELVGMTNQTDSNPLSTVGGS